jgi:flagellar hook assembly protein FlgD
MQAFMDMQNLQAQSITNASATPLLGKEVRVMESTFHHTGKCSRDFKINVLEGNSQGNVIIKDKDGNVLGEVAFTMSDSKGGDTVVKWDGKNHETGELYLGGDYKVEVKSTNGAKDVGYAYDDGMVNRVDFSSSGAALTVNGVKYALAYLVMVKNADSST